MQTRLHRRTAFLLSGACLLPLGLARFSFALVLPSMKASLGLGYGAAGLLGTANTFGYLVGSLLIPRLTATVPVHRLFRAGVLGTLAAIALTGTTHVYGVIALARFLAGLFGAASFILGSTYAAALSGRGSDAVAVFNAGAGIGVVGAGLLLPGLLDGHADRWPQAWRVLAVIGVVGAIAALSARLPASTPKTPSGATNTEPPTTATEPPVSEPPDSAPSGLGRLAACYVCFGTGYIVYVTFLISVLRAAHASARTLSLSFVTLGICALCAVPAWRPVLRRWPLRTALAGTLAAQASAGLLLAISTAPGAVFVSSALFGGSFLMTPAIVTMVVRAERPPASWTTSLARVTAVFAVGQAIAPWLSGLAIDAFGTRTAPIWTAVCSVVGALIARGSLSGHHRDLMFRLTEQVVNPE